VTSEERRARAIEVIAPYVERARSFSGWSFEDLGVVDVDPPPVFDYVAVAREHAASAQRVLDVGTGGGEVYSRIIAGVGARCVASEEWHVNAPVARDRLRSLGVEVVHASSERTPWRDASFDLMLSRHEAIDPLEVARVVAPGGTFITRQVAKEHWQELWEFFPDKTVWPDHFVLYRKGLEAAGFEVTTEYHTWRAAYPNIGAVAYMLLVAPWELPGFDPVRDVDRLLALEDTYGDERGIVLTLAAYLMVARRPPA
jgi:SAM-dependent methyltransferase